MSSRIIHNIRSPPAAIMECPRCGLVCDETVQDIAIMECTRKECARYAFHMCCAEDAVDIFQRRQTAGSRRDLDDKKLRRHDYTGDCFAAGSSL